LCFGLFVRGCVFLERHEKLQEKSSSSVFLVTNFWYHCISGHVGDMHGGVAALAHMYEQLGNACFAYAKQLVAYLLMK